MTGAQHRQLGSRALIGAALLLMTPGAAPAQDIRGLEVCTAEKQLERRTGCLQSNIEFLQQALAKLTRETNEKLAAAARDLTGAKAEIAALKSALAKLDGELAQMKTKAEPGAKKQ
jgi:chromosome segregation ATPase